jgi:hypothetical protein
MIKYANKPLYLSKYYKSILARCGKTKLIEKTYSFYNYLLDSEEIFEGKESGRIEVRYIDFL